MKTNQKTSQKLRELDGFQHQQDQAGHFISKNYSEKLNQTKAGVSQGTGEANLPISYKGHLNKLPVMAKPLKKTKVNTLFACPDEVLNHKVLRKTTKATQGR